MLQKWPTRHGVWSLDPAAQKWVGVQFTGADDPAAHRAPSGHVWFSDGVGHTRPAAHRTCCVVPAGQL